MLLRQERVEPFSQMLRRSDARNSGTYQLGHAPVLVEEDPAGGTILGVSEGLLDLHIAHTQRGRSPESAPHICTVHRHVRAAPFVLLASSRLAVALGCSQGAAE